MEQYVERFRTVRQPPLWSYGVLAVVTTLAFAVAFPFSPDILPDILLEGLYLALALVIAVPIRRLGIGVFEIGWLIFLFGRLVDFLDELFLEPEPLVEPYISGFIMVVSFSILLAGAVTLLDEREEKIAELEARAEELELKNTAIEAAPLGITIADTTAEDQPLITVNDGFTRVTGYEESETVGRNCRFLQGAATSEEPVAEMREAIENGESVQVVLRNYRNDGTLFWNEVTLAPLERDGEVPHYVGFQQDVTDRIEYQKRVQDQRDNLQLLSQMVRHDIRNDLQIIQMNVDLLEEHVTDDGADLLDTVAERTSDAIDLTTTARELSDMMLDDDPEKQAVSLVATLDEQIDAIRSAYPQATIERDDPLPDVTVDGDEMLDSVFRNLLKNAVQHNDTDAPEVVVSATASDEAATVRIADNGPGIPDERKADLFGEGEKGLESEGTGIGTYLVDRLVTRYGGEIRIIDNDPRGAVFVVTLPRSGESSR